MGLGLILSAFLVWVPPRRSPAPTQLSYLCVCTITCTLSCGGRQSLWKVSVGVFGVPVGRPSVKTTRDLHGVPPLRKNSCSLGDGLDGSLSALVCGQPKGILFVFFACALPPPSSLFSSLSSPWQFLQAAYIPCLGILRFVLSRVGPISGVQLPWGKGDSAVLCNPKLVLALFRPLLYLSSFLSNGIGLDDPLALRHYFPISVELRGGAAAFLQRLRVPHL